MADEQVQIAILVEAARLYYQHGLSQQEVADKLGVSRPSVSRLLTRAREMGIVRIDIIDPAESGTRLENDLVAKFGLRHAVVVPNHASDEQVIKNRLGQATVILMDTIISEGCTLGVSWGTTMMAMTERLRSRKLKNMVVVQLNGGISKAEFDTHATEIAQKIGDNYQATPYLLPLPAVVDSPELKQAIISDSNIAKTLELARKAEIALFTIGSFGFDSVLVAADYFEKEEVDDLLVRGAVGDICSRIITDQGEICSAELDARTIGLELDELKAKEYSIAVAGGANKSRAISAALKGQWFNVLITDETVAQDLLAYE